MSSVIAHTFQLSPVSYFTSLIITFESSNEREIIIIVILCDELYNKISFRHQFSYLSTSFMYNYVPKLYFNIYYANIELYVLIHFWPAMGF